MEFTAKNAVIFHVIALENHFGRIRFSNQYFNQKIYRKFTLANLVTMFRLEICSKVPEATFEFLSKGVSALAEILCTVGSAI